MAYCTNCGAVLGAGANYCRGCGSAVYYHPVPDPPLDETRRSWPLKTDRLDKTVGLVVLVVATAVITLYVLLAWVIPFLEGFLKGFLEGLLG